MVLQAEQVNTAFQEVPKQILDLVEHLVVAELIVLTAVVEAAAGMEAALTNPVMISMVIKAGAAVVLIMAVLKEWLTEAQAHMLESIMDLAELHSS